jgi:hypothetical protein
MAVYGHLIVEKRVKVLVWSAETKSVTNRQRIFRTNFRTRYTRARNATPRLFTTFEEERSVKEEKRLRIPNVQTPAAAEDTLCGKPA